MTHWKPWVCVAALTLNLSCAQGIVAAECGLSCCVAAGAMA